MTKKLLMITRRHTATQQHTQTGLEIAREALFFLLDQHAHQAGLHRGDGDEEAGDAGQDLLHLHPLSRHQACRREGQPIHAHGEWIRIIFIIITLLKIYEEIKKDYYYCTLKRTSTI